MVRVGGGYVTIEEYYNRYSTKQCVALYQIMTNKGTTFLDTVVGLLSEYQVDQSIINEYLAGENWENTNLMFLMLATIAEAKMKILNQKSAATKKKKTKKVAFSYDLDLSQS